MIERDTEYGAQRMITGLDFLEISCGIPDMRNDCLLMISKP